VKVCVDAATWRTSADLTTVMCRPEVHQREERRLAGVIMVSLCQEEVRRLEQQTDGLSPGVTSPSVQRESWMVRCISDGACKFNDRGIKSSVTGFYDASLFFPKFCIVTVNESIIRG